jgi:hypothetical protein
MKYDRRNFLKLGLTVGGGLALGDTVAHGSLSEAASAIPKAGRAVPEGVVPLVAVEGTAYECGYQYGRIVREKYPGYRRYLDQARDWKAITPEVKTLFERQAPYILDVYRGLMDADKTGPQSNIATEETGCSSFGVSGDITLDGEPISGQTKDTVLESAYLYIVLRMRIKDGPVILVLAYPGEILGYGLWSTGMSIFRNALYSTADAAKGLTMVQWGLLALAGKTTEQAGELAKKFGIQQAGNCLISDGAGKSLSVEFNAGGVSLVPAQDGIATHANHPVGRETALFYGSQPEIQISSSCFRMSRLRELLNNERGRLTAQKAMSALADHEKYPFGLCRHLVDKDISTTAGVIAEPTKGKLHVVRGNPCCAWPVTYNI